MDVTIFYANHNMQDIGVLKSFKLDMSISSEYGENNYEIRTPVEGIELHEGYFIYAENCEYGGIVDTKRINTKDKTLYYSGRTWRGLLESKIIVPPANQDYYKVSGDLSVVLDRLIDDFSLDDLFYADSTLTGVTVTNYQFYRYTDVYSGIVNLLSSKDYKLVIEFNPLVLKCKVSAVPIIDYGEYQEITSDLYDFDISKVRGTVNHLIGLGQGELKDRTVVHLYANANGVISNTQSLFGKDEVVSIYDYSIAEDATELREAMMEEFYRLIGSDNVKITLNNINADVGDRITAYEEITKTEAVQYIQSKVITIDDSSIKTQYSAKTVKITQNGEAISNIEELKNTFVKKSGDTMTGMLTVPDLFITHGAQATNINTLQDDYKFLFCNTQVTTGTHPPISGQYYFLICFGFVQIAIQYSTHNMFARGYINNQWYDWKDVSEDRVLKSGDTMTDHLKIAKNGAVYVEVQNTSSSTNKRLWLIANSGTEERIGLYDPEGQRFLIALDKDGTLRFGSSTMGDIYLKGKLLDYPIEEGTSGQWTYKKWSNGDYECYREYSNTLTINQSLNGAYHSTTISLNLPTTMVSIQDINIQSRIGGIWCTAIGSSLSQVQFYFNAVSSLSSATYTAFVSVKGKWK